MEICEIYLARVAGLKEYLSLDQEIENGSYGRKKDEDRNS